MTYASTSPVRLADDIARLITTLDDHLLVAGPKQGAEILRHVIDTEDGVLGRITGVLITAAHRAKVQAEDGTASPELALALGRAANTLNDAALDLNDHADELKRLAQPSGSPAAVARPAASAMVARRRR
ncbi:MULTISPECIES: hypothetical protein [Streptomyces]|uniref:Uncharacterized protein n=1 Tax=Streptomyces ramulosus TaxID=47762 RepID=A0ABW1FSL6_9ACTN